MHRLLSIVCAALLGACAAHPGPNTPSGNLTITVAGVRGACVRETVANAAVALDYAIKSRSDYQIIAGRPRPELKVEERLSIVFLPQPAGGALKIVIYADSVSHPGSPFESFQPTRPTQLEQEHFEVLKDKIESTCAAHAV